MAFLALLIVGITFFCYYYKYSSNKSNTEHLGMLTPNAYVVDVQHSKDRWWRDVHIKTIVRFSDGFQYETFKARPAPGFGCTRLIVDNEVVNEIIADAKAAHLQLCKERGMDIASIEKREAIRKQHEDAVRKLQEEKSHKHQQLYKSIQSENSDAMTIFLKQASSSKSFAEIAELWDIMKPCENEEMYAALKKEVSFEKLYGTDITAVTHFLHEIQNHVD